MRQQASELALVLEHQQLVSPLVTPLRALDELLIDLAIAHLIPESVVVVPAERQVRQPACSLRVPDPRWGPVG